MSELSRIISEIGQAERRHLREPRPRPGEIRLKWGKLRDMDPDLVVAGGEGTSKPTRALVMHAFTEGSYSPVGMEWEPSLAEELHRRGYDLRTLRFSIRKRDPQPPR